MRRSPFRRSPFLLLAAVSGLATAFAAGPAAAQTTALEPAFPGLSFAEPIELTHPGDGSGRLYVAEKAGRVVSFEGVRTTATATVALDIRPLVESRSEWGLLGIAFHPAFARTGYLYVHYSGRPDGRTVLARYTRSAANPAVFDPASALVVLEVAQPFENHKGGKLAFGPDGFLYLSLGDGGGAGDPGDRAQNRTTLLGKLLRIDVDQPAQGLAYGIPPDNPFRGNASGFREEIYALGLRNMFKFSFDRATGALWGADVGQDRWEEVNLVTNGGNYGWRVREGAHCFRPLTGCATVGLTDPVYEYAHPAAPDAARSVTGGVVYRGARNPDLVGAYLFADYLVGDVWALSGSPVSGSPLARRTVARAGFAVIGFGEDAAGEVYVLMQDGRVLRFVAPPSTSGEAVTPAETPALRVSGPNPFASRTTVEVAAAEPGAVRVTLHDVLGRTLGVVFDGPVAAGERRTISVDGTALAPGVYVVRLAGPGGARSSLRLLLSR